MRHRYFCTLSVLLSRFNCDSILYWIVYFENLKSYHILRFERSKFILYSSILHVKSASRSRHSSQYNLYNNHAKTLSLYDRSLHHSNLSIILKIIFQKIGSYHRIIETCSSKIFEKFVEKHRERKRIWKKRERKREKKNN